MFLLHSIYLHKQHGFTYLDIYLIIGSKTPGLGETCTKLVRPMYPKVFCLQKRENIVRYTRASKQLQYHIKRHELAWVTGQVSRPHRLNMIHNPKTSTHISHAHPIDNTNPRGTQHNNQSPQHQSSGPTSNRVLVICATTLANNKSANLYNIGKQVSHRCH